MEKTYKTKDPINSKPNHKSPITFNVLRPCLWFAEGQVVTLDKLTEYYTARGIIELMHYGYVETVDTVQTGSCDNTLSAYTVGCREVNTQRPKPGEWWVAHRDDKKHIFLLGEKQGSEFKIKLCNYLPVPENMQKYGYRPATEEEIEKTLLELAELKGFEGQGVYQEWVLPWSEGDKPINLNHRDGGSLYVLKSITTPNKGHIIYKGHAAIYSDKHGFAELKKTEKTRESFQKKDNKKS